MKQTKVEAGVRVQISKTEEEFALSLDSVNLDLNTDEGHIGASELEDLAGFAEYWENSGLPPKDPSSGSKQQPSHISEQQMPPLGPRSMVSGATSPTEADGAGDSVTHASESYTGTGTGADDHISTLSNDTDDCDTASRSSVKRRRTAGIVSSGSSLGFQPLGPVKEGSAHNGDADGDVRPWKVDIPDHDVVLGDTHEPTWGTKIYRDVRKPYAKKSITNEQLKLVKVEFQRRLEKERGRLSAPPVFWCNKESKTKTKQIPVSGFLKNRPGITYAYAKDQAIKEDIKNASARPRTRASKHFTFKGSLDDVIHKAIDACDVWVGEDIDKELYAKGFKEDIERLVPWRREYIQRKEDCEQRAMNETVMRGTHLREARIHETHASHLDVAMVDMINQLGNMMIESYRMDAKKTPRSDTFSTGDSSAGAASSRNSKSHTQAHAKVPNGVAFEEHRSMSTIQTNPTGRKSRKQKSPEPRTNFRPIDGVDKMDLSPIDIRKGLLAVKLEADEAAIKTRKDLSSMFSQNLRVASQEDFGNGIDMPSGVPREVRPDAPDELSVISAPDDMSLAFMEARESAIRRGLDQPAALPQSGHVADRTKALLQQMKHRKNSNPN